MKQAAQPSVTIGVALAGAGLIVAAPMMLPVPDLQAHYNIQLTSWQDVLDAQLNFNSWLTKGLFDVNGGLVDFQHKLVPGLAILAGASVDPVDHYAIHGLAKDAVEQFFDANNAQAGASQAALLGLLGVRGTMDDQGGFTQLDLADLNTSLLVDARHEESIPFAGLESAIGHYLGSAVFLSAALSGTPESELETNDAADSFVKVVADVTAFNHALLSAENAFDTTLVSTEMDLEEALFGTDNALNGVINRAFNAFNMMFDAWQQGFNGLLGVTGYDPQEYTAALLTGSSAQVFNDGSVGGLLGMANQSLAALTNLGGLFLGDGEPWTGNGFTPDPEAVTGAFHGLMTTLSNGMFGDVFSSDGAFSVLLTDLYDLFSASLAS